MRDLFLAECRRFRNAALIFAALHLAAQLFLARMVDVLQLGWGSHLIALALFMTAALAFALVQFGGYRQPSRWLWLLHRPMARGAIFGAIALASYVLIMFAVGLPALVTVLATDLLSARVVDTRHYLMVAELVLLAMIAWTAGSYVSLNRSRTAIVLLVLPLLLLTHLASGFAMLAPTLACLALMLAIALGAFKPDRHAPAAGITLMATAAPLLLGFYVALIWIVSLAFQNGQILLGVHPLNSSVAPAGGYTEATRAEGRDLLQAGLANATDPRAAVWRRQIPLIEIANFEANAGQYPVRHQFSNLDRLVIADDKRHIDWTFSHDAMRFQGRDAFTGAAAGWLGLSGIGDPAPFPAVPLLSAPGNIMTPQSLHVWNAETGAVVPRIRLAAPETLTREPEQIGDLQYVLTNLRLIAYARPIDGAASTLLQERFSVYLPAPFSHLDRVDVGNLLDGNLISLTFGRAMASGGGEATQTVLFVDASARTRLIAQRQLTHDFPILFEHHDWWLSPPLHLLKALPDALLDKGKVLDKGRSSYTNALRVERAPVVWAAALAMALLSALAAWLWLAGTGISYARKVGWLAACLLFGLPGVATMMVLQARAPMAASFRSARSARAAA